MTLPFSKDRRRIWVRANCVSHLLGEAWPPRDQGHPNGAAPGAARDLDTGEQLFPDPECQVEGGCPTQKPLESATCSLNDET